MMEPVATLGEYNGITIGCRQSDQFVNATAMCQATGKRWGHYFENRQTQEFLDSLARQLVCRNSDSLVSKILSGPNDHRGTWVHRRVAIHLAQWCSPDFAVWVTGQIEAIMTGNRVAHREVAEHKLVSMQNDISVLHSKYESLVTRVLDMQEQNQQLLGELLPMMKRVDERTQGRREGFNSDVEKRFIRCAERFYKGQCPCCQSVQIIKSGRRVAHVAQLDHYHHRSMNRLEHGWIVCKSCNNRLKNRKPNGFWFQAGPAFQQFQRLLHQEPNQLLLFAEVGQ